MSTSVEKTNFIRNIIDNDLAQNKNNGKVITRFPPEPNGYLHIGHAKSIHLNFSIANIYKKGPCHLRFDDTNPATESVEFMDSIMKDIKWLGYNWGTNLYYSSNYFSQLYQLAIFLIKKGKAYVCSLSPEEVKSYRGTLKSPGKNSPYRERSIDENLELFEKMKNNCFSEGSHSLRAKIDMSSGNINLRDPMLYRIKKMSHYQTGNEWSIYPMYDFAHAISDSLEGITHSLCTLEFQDHRALYNWIIKECEMNHTPIQYEFSRLNLNYTITSKRKLKSLVEGNNVKGWDDPRMPTISGLRRRGYTPQSIRDFCDEIGISKQDSVIDMALLEEAIRNDLNKNAHRRMAVLDPLLINITNHDEISKLLNIPNHPQNPDFGRRNISFSNQLYIERDDFQEEATPGFKRLLPNGRVRLMNGYVIECKKVIYENNKVSSLECIYLPETLGGKKPSDGTKIKGIIQWVDARSSVNAEIRIYDRLFTVENPSKYESIHDALNPNSLKILHNAKIEPSLALAAKEESFQFNRIGYFCADKIEHSLEKPVFNRTVTLRDVWKKQ